MICTNEAAHGGAYGMTNRLILVEMACDEEARIWYVAHSSLAGLSAEPSTVDALIERPLGMIVDLAEENGPDGDPQEVAIRVVASRTQRIALQQPA